MINATLEKPLPSSPDSERAILGSIIINNSVLGDAQKLLTAEDFYATTHRHIFRAMASLARRGVELDPILIAEELRRDNLLEQAGGVALISGLTHGIPHVTSITAYAEIVAEKSARRRFIKECAKLASVVVEGDNLQTAVDCITSAINHLRDSSSLAGVGHSSSLRTVCIDDVMPEEVSWLWHPYIPVRKLTILEGDPGLGKSWLTCALATAVSRGHGLPGGSLSEPANVLMLSAEDGLADTLRPRLETLGADMEKVFALDEPLTLDVAGLLRLEAGIAYHAPTLVIIDPLFAYTGSKVDIHRANECRAISTALKDIAERQGCSIVALRHLSKGAGRTAMSAGLGSIDIRAAARSVLLVGVDPDDTSQRAIIQTKNNLSQEGTAIGFEIKDGAFRWTGKSSLTAERMLASPSNEEERGARSDAVEFLRHALSAGPRAITDILEEGARLGLSRQMLRTARTRLNGCSIKEGQPGQKGQRWMWSLPVDTDPHVEDVSCQVNQPLRVNADCKRTYSHNLPEGVTALLSNPLRGSATSSVVGGTLELREMFPDQESGGTLSLSGRCNGEGKGGCHVRT